METYSCAYARIEFRKLYWTYGDIQPIGDANIKIADLEDTRKEIVALSGIPAPYLGGPLFSPV